MEKGKPKPKKIEVTKDEKTGFVKKEEYDKLKGWYQEELLRRDKIIEDLEKRNLILIKASIKTSERLTEIQDLKKKKVENKGNNKLDSATDN